MKLFRVLTCLKNTDTKKTKKQTCKTLGFMEKSDPGFSFFCGWRGGGGGGGGTELIYPMAFKSGFHSGVLHIDLMNK